ncbi:ABC transporter ATP-binding protein [Phyllobacterium sp. K27]
MIPNTAKTASSMNGEAALAGENLSFSVGGRLIIDAVSCRIQRGRITALIGPNGSGKSTLMRLLMRLEKPSSGRVMLSGHDASGIGNRDFARSVAFLPQDMQTPPAMLVRDLVACGRHPHRSLWRMETASDRAAINEALSIADLSHLANRPMGALSGGERQRALIAMALAQETEILMLDEPTTYLDLRYQIQILELVLRLHRERNMAVCWILHDLNEAAAYSDDVMVLSQGRCVAYGAPETVLTPHVVHDIFGVQVLSLSHPEDGGPILVPSRGFKPFRYQDKQ